MVSDYIKMFLERACSPKWAPAWLAEDMLHLLEASLGLPGPDLWGVPFRWDLGHSNRLCLSARLHFISRWFKKSWGMCWPQHSFVRTSGLYLPRSHAACQSFQSPPTPHSPCSETRDRASFKLNGPLFPASLWTEMLCKHPQWCRSGSCPYVSTNTQTLLVAAEMSCASLLCQNWSFSVIYSSLPLFAWITLQEIRNALSSFPCEALTDSVCIIAS